jgi:hypothetical protein
MESEFGRANSTTRTVSGDDIRPSDSTNMSVKPVMPR